MLKIKNIFYNRLSFWFKLFILIFWFFNQINSDIFADDEKYKLSEIYLDFDDIVLWSDDKIYVYLKWKNFDYLNQISWFQFELNFPDADLEFFSIKDTENFNKNLTLWENFFSKDGKIFFLWWENFLNIEKNFLEFSDEKKILEIIFNKKNNNLIQNNLNSSNLFLENKIFSNILWENILNKNLQEKIELNLNFWDFFIKKDFKKIEDISLRTWSFLVETWSLIKLWNWNLLWNITLKWWGWEKIILPEWLNFNGYSWVFMPPVEIQRSELSWDFLNSIWELNKNSKIISIWVPWKKIFLSKPVDVEFNVNKCFDENFIKYYDDWNWKSDWISDVFCENNLIKFRTNHFSEFANTWEDWVITNVVNLIKNSFWWNSW
jgi:hypothetical protein